MLDIGKVVRVHPEAETVDLLMLEDGRQLVGVQILGGGDTSGETGVACLATPDSAKSSDPFEAVNSGARDVFAIVGRTRRYPIVVGFLRPTVSQMKFADVDRYLNRTPSDVYWTVDSAGNAELAHPSGVFVRIGTSPNHEDLTGKDYAGRWKIERNTQQLVHIHVENPGKFVLDVDPAGNVTMVAAGSVSVSAGGAVSVASNVSIEMRAPSISMND